MFIDGLDEFEGRYDGVIEAVGGLAKQSHVKISLSSRPVLDFERAFADKPQLKLQDMTFDSIRAYADDQLLNLIQRRFTKNKHNHDKAKRLLDRIVEQADGVFLWVVLAIHDVRDGLQDFADLDELARAIEDLPAGVDDLYMKILKRIKPAYRRDAARFLQIILCHFPPSDYDVNLCRLYFIDREKRVVEDLPFVYEKIDRDDLVQACGDLQTRLLSHTVGLLDLTPNKRWNDGSSGRDPILYTRVLFHHRTVRDFLLHNTAAKAFVAGAGILEQHVHLSIARGTVAHHVHISQRGHEFLLNGHDFHKSLYLPLISVMEQVSIIEHLIDASQGRFLRSLHDYSFTRRNPRGPVEYGLEYGHMLINLRQGWTDLIGLAAMHGVGRYVCEVLDLAFVEFVGSSELNLGGVHGLAKDEAVIRWIPSMNHPLDPFHYREQLNECLEWKSDEDGQIPVDRNTLAETYLLACCDMYMLDYLTPRLTLVQILLQAGANPMVRFKPVNAPFEPEPYSCF